MLNQRPCPFGERRQFPLDQCNLIVHASGAVATGIVLQTGEDRGSIGLEMDDAADGDQ